MRSTNRCFRNARARRFLTLAAATGGLALASTANAQQLFFDNNAAASGLGSGTGTWLAANTNWSTTTAGTTDQTWTAGATANFNAGFTVLVGDSESLSGINFNSGSTTLGVLPGSTGALLDFGSNPFSITSATAIGGSKEIILTPIKGSGDMTVNMITTGSTNLAGDMSQFTGNIYANNISAVNAQGLSTVTADFQINNNYGSSAQTIYVDQNTRLDNNNPVTNNGLSSPTNYSINSNVLLNYKGVANANEYISSSNGKDGTSTLGQATFVAGAQLILTFGGVISSAPGVNTNVYIGLNNGGRGTVVLANHNTWSGNTTVTLASNNGLLQMGIDNALPTSTTLIFGTSSNATVAPMDLNGHSITLGGLSTVTTANNNNANGGADNGNIYNTSLTGSPAADATITITGSANTTYAGDIGCTNLSVNPFNNQAPYVTGSATLGTAQQIVQASRNISLVLNGPGSLTLAPVSNQQNGNEYSGTTTVNGGKLVFGRTSTFPAGGTPSSVYTLTGGSNVIINSGGTVSSLPTTFGGANNNSIGGASGTITLNSGASLTPGGAGTTGVLATNAINFNANSSISFDLTNASNFDQIFANLSLDSTSANHTINLSLTPGGTLVPGSYNLITGSISGDAANAASFTLNTSSISTGDQFKLIDTGSALQLQILAPALRWDPTGAGANSTVTEGGGTWTDGSAFVNLLNSPQTEVQWSNTAFTSSDVILGSDVSQAGDVINLGENITVGGKLTFGPIFPNSADFSFSTNYSISGNGYSLKLNGGISVNNLAAQLNSDGTLARPSAEIDSPVILGADQTWSVDPGQFLLVTGPLTGNFALTKAGAGTVVLNGAGGSIGSLTVTGGIAQFGAADAIGNAPITLNGGGVIFYNLTGTLPNALTIGPNGGQVGTTTGNTLTLSNNISTTNAFGVVGTGTVAFTGNNSFGTLDLFGGALSVNSQAAFGNPTSISTGTNSALSIVLNSSVPLSINGAISGAGNLVLQGPDFTLAGPNTIGPPGGVGNSGGSVSFNTANQTVHVTNASGLGAGTTVIGVSYPVTAEIDAPIVTSGAIRNNAPGGLLHKTGAGTWILAGHGTANSDPGGTLSIDNGAVQLNDIAALGNTNVSGGITTNGETTPTGLFLQINSGGSLIVNTTTTRYSNTITLNGGSIIRPNNSAGTGDMEFSSFNSDDATMPYTSVPLFVVTADSTIDNQETTGGPGNSRDILILMPTVINPGATLTAQSEDTSPRLESGTVIFRGVANNTNYPSLNLTIKGGGTLKTAGVGEIDLGGSGRGEPIVGQGTPGNDAKFILTSNHTFMRDAGSFLQGTGGTTDATRLIINGSGNAGLRVEAPMNAVYTPAADGTRDASTSGLFGFNTANLAGINDGLTVLSNRRAYALSNPYTFADTTTITPSGTLTLAANNSTDATGVVDVGPAVPSNVSLALDNTASSANANLTYQFDGTASHTNPATGSGTVNTGAFLANYASIVIQQSNTGSGSVKGQLLHNARFQQLSILNTAKFDLVDHALVLESSTNISSYLSNHQLYSSSVDADTQAITTIAQVTGAQLGLTGTDTLTLQGITLDANSFLLKPAYFGDINLDGRINGDDYALLDRSYAKHLPANWIDGDFNNDGLVNPADYMLIDRSFALTNGNTLSPSLLAQREAQFGDAYVQSLISSVPEPSLLSIALAFPLIRRRR